MEKEERTAFPPGRVESHPRSPRRTCDRRDQKSQTRRRLFSLAVKRDVYLKGNLLTNAGGYGYQARILMPNEISHCQGSDGLKRDELSSALIANTTDVAKAGFEEEIALKE